MAHNWLVVLLRRTKFTTPRRPAIVFESGRYVTSTCFLDTMSFFSFVVGTWMILIQKPGFECRFLQDFYVEFVLETHKAVAKFCIV